jgi:predicted TIM-barrel fold metal-dependent hydrolase
MLVDFHTHFFGRTLFEALASSARLSGTVEERIERAAVQLGIQVPGSTEEHLARWLAELDRYGVGHLVSFASAPEEAPAVAEAVRLSEGRLSGMVVVDPKRPEAAERLAASLDDDGFRGALLFPAMHAYSIQAPEAAEVLGVLEERGSVAVVHCGLLRVALREAFGHPRCYDPGLSNPLALVPVANAFPNVSFVVPHFGAGFFRETLMAGTQCSNVLVDTSSSNSWIQTQPEAPSLADVFERALRVFGPERILFGTDSSTFPRGWRQDVLRAQREALGACGLDAPARERILGGNASRLLGLDVSG